jgi:hypothetical protein
MIFLRRWISADSTCRHRHHKHSYGAPPTPLAHAFASPPLHGNHGTCACISIATALPP